MVKVYTARLNYKKADRLDVTRLGVETMEKQYGVPTFGRHFAPSREILDPMLRKRKAGGIGQSDFEQYEREYVREMVDSRKASPDAWEHLLKQEEVTLVCYCTNPEQCHRTVLARILVGLGATYHGERVANTRQTKLGFVEPSHKDD